MAVATYNTEWKYDSFGRLLEMTYPDEEKIVYKYDLGGNLCKVFGKKNYLYTYIDTIAYDLFGQRSYIRYGNGAETRYSYSSNRQRLSNLTVNANNVKVMDNTYKYDVMDNITSLVNAGRPQALQDGRTIGGTVTHTYRYDEWDRLIGAKGTFNGGGSKSAAYDLRMEYDRLYNVTSKQLSLTQKNLQFDGEMSTGYKLAYNYKEDDPFRLQSIDSREFGSDMGADDTLRRTTNYDFDGNGNLTLQMTDTEQDSAHCADTMGTRVKNHLWDEENRLLAINDNGFVSNYFYDANGERTVKLSKPDLFVYVNSSEKLKGDSLPVKFVGYVSPYLVVTNGGRYTKHIYAGTQRIASKLGDIEAFGADPRRVVTAGHDVDGAEPIDFSTKYKNQNNAFTARFDSLGSKFNGKSLDDYVNGKSFCCNGNSLDEIEKNETNTAENAKLEDNLYFYHPDHLGSTNLITNFDGEVTQSVAYIPYGEVFVEERNGSWATPFLFNAKELDEETGLYYYGARYYDPTATSWLSVDPKWGDYKGVSPYAYCLNNPVKLVDPDGEDVIIYDVDGNESFTYTKNCKYEGNSEYIKNAVNALNETYTLSDRYGNIGDDYISPLVNSKSETFVITQGKSSYYPANSDCFVPSGDYELAGVFSSDKQLSNNNIIIWNNESLDVTNTTLSGNQCLTHEIGHAIDYLYHTPEEGLSKMESYKLNISESYSEYSKAKNFELMSDAEMHVIYKFNYPKKGLIPGIEQRHARILNKKGNDWYTRKNHQGNR